jgi:hypothetical protein
MGGFGELQGFGTQQTLSPLWRWDGLQWTRLGLPDSWKRSVDGQSVPVQIKDLVVRDDELFVLGDFTQAGGVPARGMVRFILLPATLAEWRTLHFSPAQQVDPLASGDEADPDGDGMTNLEEFQAGTDPWSAEGRFDLEPLDLVRNLANNGTVTLTLLVEPHRTYTVQFRDGSDPWRKLVDLPAHEVSHLERVVDRAPTAVFRTYRAVTPAQP